MAIQTPPFFSSSCLLPGRKDEEEADRKASRGATSGCNRQTCRAPAFCRRTGTGVLEVDRKNTHAFTLFLHRQLHNPSKSLLSQLPFHLPKPETSTDSWSRPLLFHYLPRSPQTVYSSTPPPAPFLLALFPLFLVFFPFRCSLSRSAFLVRWFLCWSFSFVFVGGFPGSLSLSSSFWLCVCVFLVELFRFPARQSDEGSACSFFLSCSVKSWGCVCTLSLVCCRQAFPSSL